MVSADVARPAPPRRPELLWWGFDTIATTPDVSPEKGPNHVIVDGQVVNIVSLSLAAGKFAVVGHLPREKSLSAIVLTREGRVLESRGREVHRVALGPGARWLAATMQNREGSEDTDICLWDLSAQAQTHVVVAHGSPGTALSWHPNGNLLAYDVQFVTSEVARTVETTGTVITTTTYGSRIETVDVRSKEVKTLFPGLAPAWSPDGSKLAYHDRRQVLVYDNRSGKTAPLMARGEDESDFTGPVSWSPDGRRLAVNVKAGEMEEGLECFVVEVASRNARSLGESTYSCGPWLE